MDFSFIKPKLLLIGWDAADWKVINPLLEQGLMPSLERMINNGVMANLATMDPPYSPMLWTSIATGKRPYKHGILGFHEPADNATGMRPVLSTSRKCKAIWNILSQQDYKTHVAGWWPSHPAEPINGIMLSDFYQKPTGPLNVPWKAPTGAVHPPEAIEHFASLRVHPEELTSSHLDPFIPNYEKATREQQVRMQSVLRETAMAASLHSAFTNIIRTQDWDFAALYLATIDHYSHGFMKYHPPKRPHIPQEDYDLFKDVVTAGYRFHDMMLGRLLEMVDDDTYVMLVSDHGFQPDHLRPRNIPEEPAGPAYEHSPQGIFVMQGPGLKKDSLLFGASVLDITPTILSCFDLPVGEDMDGKVLTQIFEQERPVASIETWEKQEGPGDAGMHQGAEAADEDMAAKVLEQLVALGYVAKPTDNAEKNRKYAQDESDFNLARAYIDGGLVDEAIPLLRKLYKENVDTPRYGFRLAICLQELGQFKECRAVISTLRDREFFNKATLDVMEASLLLGEGRPIEAIKLFKESEGKVNAFHARLQMQIAKGYVLLRRWEDAERALLTEIEMDYDNHEAHGLLGQVYLQDQRYGKAADALLRAIGLEYEYPNAHYWLGNALRKLGEYKRAAEAYEVVLMLQPHAGKVRQELIELYIKHLNQPDKARSHRDVFDDKMLGTITIVSGLPRSGTSMMMQMLEKGGIPIFTDKGRTADDNNPKGYYEHEAVKTLPRKKEWLLDAKDKCVKVIANLLIHLPPRFRYRIIFMERDLQEVVASQQKMLQRLGEESSAASQPDTLLQEYERTLTKVKNWLSRQENLEILYLNHREVLENPFETALRVNDFLGYTLLPELMAGVVDASLYREKVVEF